MKKRQRRKDQSDELIVCEELKTAAGGTGSGSGGGMPPGARLVCRILEREPGGFSVYFPRQDLYGFLPTERGYSTGDECLCQFVCWDKNRLLVSELFTATMPESDDVVDWQKQLEEPDEG